MRRRVSAVVAAATLAAGLLAGCGIPDSTGVRVDGPGPRSGPGGVQFGGETGPPKRKSATTTGELVSNFLAAAAGDSDGLAERMNDYIAAGARDEIDLTAGVSVVHLLSDPSPGADGTVYTLRVRHLGTLMPDGELRPPAPTDAQATYTMRVGEVDDRRELYVMQPPPVVLMTDEALNKYYSERTIYFWNRAYTALVPDLRYLPTEVPAARMPTEVLGWLVKGPSRALNDVVEPLPAGSKLVGTAPLEGDSLTTSWSPEAARDEQGAQRLALQVVWSLWHAPFERMELRVNGQQAREYGVDALRSAVAYPVSPSTESYAIYDGVVRALRPTEGDPTPQVPLAPEINHDLLGAAIMRGAKVAVAATVNTAAGPRLQVGDGVGVVAALKPTAVEPAGRPVWLPGTGDRAGTAIGMVADVHGDVYRFQADGKTARVRLPVPEGVADIAVSPEGQRLAVIAAGKLYIVPVAPDKAIAAPQALPLIQSLSDPTAVAWLSETHVAVAGRGQGSRAQFGDVSVDGGVQSLRAESTTGDVTMLSAVPATPVHDTNDDPLMFQAGDRAARARGDVQMIPASDLVGVEPPATAGPGAPVPSAPFYVY